MSEVELSEISVRFAANPILNGLHLRVEEGEYFVLLGASGCGKTTTLNVIAGLQPPDSGNVSIGGADMAKVAPKDRDVSMVFQSNALYPHLTIRESLLLGLKGKCDKHEQQRRIEDATAQVGLQDFLLRKPDTLSGGELRRAALAKAIVRRSGVRLLDEPLSALDAPVKNQIQSYLLHWHESAPGTTIHVTHDGSEAMRIADRIAVIHNGKIVQSGTPKEIYRRPNCKVAATALGSHPSPMCFLAGQTVGGKLQIDGAKAPIANLNIADTKVDVGIRPNDCRIASPHDSDQPGLVFAGQIIRSDFIDGQNYSQVQLPCGQLFAKVDAAKGEDVSVFVAREDLHVYDAETSNRLDLQ